VSLRLPACVSVSLPAGLPALLLFLISHQFTHSLTHSPTPTEGGKERWTDANRKDGKRREKGRKKEVHTRMNVFAAARNGKRKMRSDDCSVQHRAKRDKREVGLTIGRATTE